MKLYDTLAERFKKIESGVEVFNPPSDQGLPLPAVLIFHGCGGRRPHLDLYADSAAEAGFRVFVIDSFTPRGWNRFFAMSMVCTGLVMQGYERSGDVLAALWDIAQRPDVDAAKIVLMGESHGGWSIMDLMTQSLTKTGQSKLHDPDPKWLLGVKGLFLIYPYINFPARSNGHGWVHKPRTLGILAKRDHLTPFAHSQKVFARLKRAGLDYEALELDATHAFDEAEFDKMGPMRFDQAATDATLKAWVGFLKQTLA